MAAQVEEKKRVGKRPVVIRRNILDRVIREKGITAGELAAKVGVGEYTLSKWRTHKQKIDDEDLAILLPILGLTKAKFFLSTDAKTEDTSSPLVVDGNMFMQDDNDAYEADPKVRLVRERLDAEGKKQLDKIAEEAKKKLTEAANALLADQILSNPPNKN